MAKQKDAPWLARQGELWGVLFESIRSDLCPLLPFKRFMCYHYVLGRVIIGIPLYVTWKSVIISANVFPVYLSNKRFLILIHIAPMGE